MGTLLTPARLCAGLLLLYGLILGIGYGRDGGWLIEANGTRRPIEFVGVRAAGELTIAGQPAAAYDWTAHRAAHDRVLGKPSDPYFAWPYPPPYLAVAAALAAMPYVLAALLMIGVTAAVYAWAAVRIAGTPSAVLWALAAPTTLINAVIAHTGFLVAALFGAGLNQLSQRPLLAGALFGLLAIKPQLGLLLPVALVAGGHWRAIAAAVVAVAALIAGSLLAFGSAPWLAMPPQLDRVVVDIIAPGQLDFHVLATVYGALRGVGIGHNAALATQAIVTVGLAGAVFHLWRSHADDALKAAGLLVASLLATPYLFIYDLTILVMALLFVRRAVGPAGFDRFETTCILSGGGLLLGYALLPLPAGFLALLLGAIVVTRRCWAQVATPAIQMAAKA